MRAIALRITNDDSGSFQFFSRVAQESEPILFRRSCGPILHLNRHTIRGLDLLQIYSRQPFPVAQSGQGLGTGHYLRKPSLYPAELRDRRPAVRGGCLEARYQSRCRIASPGQCRYSARSPRPVDRKIPRCNDSAWPGARLFQEWRLRVVALFSLAAGPRNVPKAPSSAGLLTPNQCFSLMK
jgi:hypothetical protein